MSEEEFRKKTVDLLESIDSGQMLIVTALGVALGLLLYIAFKI